MKGSKTIRTGLVFALSTIVKLCSGLIVIRLISQTIGAAGLGQLGQLMSVMGIVTLLAGGGIFTGMIKYVAELREEPIELDRYLRSGSMIIYLTSALIGIALTLSAEAISKILFGVPNYTNVIYLLGGAQFFIGFNNFALSIINGYQDVRGFAGVNIAGSLLSVGIIYLLTARFGLQGAMIGVILAPGLLCVFSVPHVFRRKFLALNQIRPLMDKFATKKSTWIFWNVVYHCNYFAHSTNCCEKNDCVTIWMVKCRLLARNESCF